MNSGDHCNTDRRASAGKPYPLGVTWDGQGANIAVFSEHGTAVHLCLFDAAGIEHERIPLRHVTDHVWHSYVVGLMPGQLYGFRVDGPYAPEEGHRFNPHKLLLDPYAKAIHGTLEWNGPIRGYDPASTQSDLSIDSDDSAPFVPKAVIVDTTFDWDGDRPPLVPWSETVIYEAHVRGLTRLHPRVDESVRGTYLGLCQPQVIAYLKDLGVTAVELLPVHAFLDEEFLVARGLRNYWGYNTHGYFAPEARYAARGTKGEQVREFKQMVRTLHENSLEVILDVVFNHTAEGAHLGPTLCYRGLDNSVYYRLMPGQPRHYVDVTGTGNTLNSRHPQVLQLIMDSLRYWVEEMHVDGFRFDLTPALARDPHDVDPRGAFVRVVHQDPVLARVKLIAEPWDLGEGGYQVGKFPVRWSEWNDRYRDAIRSFWRGDLGRGAELGYRLTGSSDLFRSSGRTPRASINFVTAHDGFTLEDLVSYQRKHNHANGEGNRDGSDHNVSTNHGHEGPTSDGVTLARRDRHKRNLLATLYLSLGVPMLCSGDEIGRTQRGNNNAYCQDNEICWLAWPEDDRAHAMYRYCRRLAAIRRMLPTLSRQTFFDGKAAHDGTRDLVWFKHDGQTMTDSDWGSQQLQAVGLLMSSCGIEIPGTDSANQLQLLLNASTRTIDARLAEPNSENAVEWTLLLDTAEWETPPNVRYRAGATVRLGHSSLQLYVRSDTAASWEPAAAR
jgi:glycogen operon protein